MSDSLRRFRSIHKALHELYPGEPRGRTARQLTTLSALVSGLVGAKHSHLPRLASQVVDRAKPASRVKRFERWLENAGVTWTLHFLPYIDLVLDSLSKHTLVLAIDGSEIGRGNVVLMVSVIYRGRALPVAWTVVSGQKGHFTESHHIALLTRVQQLLPPAADVVILGDGEFDGVNLQACLDGFGWNYVCRTARNCVVIDAEGEPFHLYDIALWPGRCIGLADVQVTNHCYGPVQVIAWWARKQSEPLYLVTNLELITEACEFYRKRFRIETFFSDQKSRGFQLHKSHIADAQRLSRFLIAACIAYLWIVYLGTVAQQQGWQALIHRQDRCDLSLFQLGLRLLEFWLNECPEQDIVMRFTFPLSEVLPSKTVTVLRANQ